jgi:uncharacterized membrane protein YjfL (UPF0719 family)
MQPLTLAADAFAWPPETFLQAAVASTVFGLIGIALAILGFKVFDWMTPGNLQEQVLQKGNVAAAILGAAFIIGVCIVVAAAIS